MKKILSSKTLAVVFIIAVIVLIVCTFKMRTEWWMFSDLFFAFMAAFCHAMSLVIKKLNPFAARKLEKTAFVSFILAILAVAVEYFALTLL